MIALHRIYGQEKSSVQYSGISFGKKKCHSNCFAWDLFDHFEQRNSKLFLGSNGFCA